MKKRLILFSPMIISVIIIAVILTWHFYPKDSVELVFQVWDSKSNSYVNVFEEEIKTNSQIKKYVPEVPSRKYYKWDQTWTPPLDEKISKSTTYKANYVPIKDTNKDGVADEEQVKIVFQVWDNKTKKYKNVYNNLVTKGTPIKELVPNVPKRTYYKTTKNWSPKLEENANTNKTYKAVYKPKNDVNKNGIADEEDKKYKITYYQDSDCTQVYREIKNILVEAPVPNIDTPTKQYYTFTNWNPTTKNLKVKKDMKLCANYKPNHDVNKNNIADEEEQKYKVTYYSDTKCTQIYKEIKDIVPGSSVPSVTKPTKKYYTFVSWTPSTNITVNKNEKFCAKWKPVNDLNKDGIADEEQDSLIPSNKYNLATKDFKNYTFVYNKETYKAVYTTDNWKIYNSYKITNKTVMTEICALLIEQHPVHGKDMKSYRTASDMAYEWEQHNIIYNILPEDHSLKDNARDVDLNPADQGKSAIEMGLDRYL